MAPQTEERVSAVPGNVVQLPISHTAPREVVSIEDQSSQIPPKKLFVVVSSLMCAIFLSAFEMVSVSTALPGIARDFGTSTAISWVGTAFLVAKSAPVWSRLRPSTSSQVIYSRFSDIFGRKILLAIAITVFTVGNLLCGFARSLGQLIVFRVIAGLGGGGIGVLVLIIISDISTLRTRGKVYHSIHSANNSI
jgi:MFS family permease